MVNILLFEFFQSWIKNRSISTNGPGPFSKISKNIKNYTDNSEFATFSCFDRAVTVSVSSERVPVSQACPCPLACPYPPSVSLFSERVRFPRACQCPFNVSLKRFIKTFAKIAEVRFFFDANKTLFLFSSSSNLINIGGGEIWFPFGLYRDKLSSR